MKTHPRRWHILIQGSILPLLVLLLMAGCGFGGNNNGGSSSTPTPGIAPTQTTIPTSTPTTPLAPFQVTNVDMAVSPSSIAGLNCGTNLAVKYTATFHIASSSPGGTVLFSYTVNNGRGQTQASLTFAPGETTKSYTFTWSGALPADHTYPEPGGVEVTSPNHLISQLVGPSGSCTLGAAFKVLSIDMAVNPTSITSLHCGTYLVVTYIATFHILANSPGGTVLFAYTTNNGRGQTRASLTFGPGETTRTYSFTWSGNLPTDHTYPEGGGVMTISPNMVNSPLVGPTGQCS